MFVLHRCGISSRYTSDELRLPRNFIQEHKMFEILLSKFNIISAPYLLILMNNVTLTLSVGGQIIIILFHTQLSLELVIGTGFICLLVTGFLVISYYKFGQINENSRKSITSWKQNVGVYSLCNKELIKRQIRALRVCKVRLGDFGYYKRANGLLIIRGRMCVCSKTLKNVHKNVLKNGKKCARKCEKMCCACEKCT